MRARPESCIGCPANELPSTQGFVPPTGPDNARLVLVGQNPGADEVGLGEPFTGPSGRQLNRWLAKAGVPRERCAITNVTWCRTTRQTPNGTKDRPPTAAETAHCWSHHTKPYLDSLKDKRVVVAVGGVSARQFVPRAKQSTFGAAVNVDGVIVLPITHPSAVIQGQWHLDPLQPRFLRRAWEIANMPALPLPPDLSAPPPGGVIARDLHTVAAFLSDVLANPVPLAVDIEGTGGVLIGIGFARMDDLRSCYVPFRDRAAPAWPDRETTRDVAYWVDRVLSDERVPKVFHNGSSFDIPFLEGIGFEIAGYADDTMVRAWATYHEAGKSLQELGIVYAGLPAWKWLSHVESDGENK